MEGNDHGEAYTAILRGGLLSRESSNIAEAEAFSVAEGNMCGTVMRGAVAPPGSKTTSRRKGMRRMAFTLVFSCPMLKPKASSAPMISR